MKKKLAVIICVRQKDGEGILRHAEEKLSAEYEVRVVNSVDKIRGLLPELYIEACGSIRSWSSSELQAWFDLRGEVLLRAPRNNALYHHAAKYK